MKRIFKILFFFSLIFLFISNFSIESKKKELLKESEKYNIKDWAKFIIENSEDVDILNFNKDNFIFNLLSIKNNLEKVEWKDKIDDSLLFYYVIPLRVSQEPVENFYKVYGDTIFELVKDLSMRDAVLKINEWCFSKMEYKPTEPYDQNATTTIKRGFGRCEEMMILFIKALRSVGIPAREAYTPYWPFTNSNHAWCEVWIDGKWYFLGGGEPGDLNNTWFKDQVKRTGIVLSPVFGKGEKGYELLNVSKNYFKPVKLKILSEDSTIVSVSVFNFAGLLPIVLDTLKDSLIFELGKNSYFIFGYKNGKMDYRIVDLFSDTSVTLEVEKDFVKDTSFFLKVSNVVKDNNESFYKPNFDSLNIVRKKNFERLEFSGKSGDSLFDTILKNSRGNYEKILSFYERIDCSKKEILKIFLKNFAPKDLVFLDTTNLYRELKSLKFPLDGIDDSIIENYLISQRIYYEPISFYRYQLSKNFKKFKDVDDEKTFEKVYRWVEKNIKDESSDNFYKTIKTPLETFILKKGSELERYILVVAILRSLNIPAKLNYDIKMISYFGKDGWKDKSFGNTENKKKLIFLKFFENGKNISKEKEIYEDFSIERFKNHPDIIEPEIAENCDSFIKVETDYDKYYLIYGFRDDIGSSFVSLKNIIGDTINIFLDSLKIFSLTQKKSLKSFKNFEKLSKYKDVRDKRKMLIFLDLNNEESISTLLINKDFIKSFEGFIYIFTNKDDKVFDLFNKENISVFKISKDDLKSFDVNILPTIIVIEENITLFWIEGLNLNLKNMIKY